MRFIIACAIVLFCLTVRAQYYSLNLDTQSPNEQPIIDRAFSGNNIWLRANIYEDGVAADLSGWAITFRYGFGQYDTNGMVTVGGTISSNRVDFLGATNIYATPFDKYYWSISGQHSSGYTKTFGTGTLKVYYDPATSTNLIALMEQVNVSWLTNSIGAQVESNRVRIAVFETSKVDTVVFNGTNLIFEGRIAAEETKSAAQIVSNALYESRITSNETFRVTTQPATNTIFRNLFVAQGSINSLFQGWFDSQVSTNSLFQGWFTTQVSTNGIFQGLFDSQASTNGLFQGWFTGQTSTNGVFQGLLDALAGTNSIFQGLFDAQANTNTGFQAFDTAQEATNAALLAAINTGGTGFVSLATYDAHVVAQENTNSFFQGLFDAIVGTNSLFQGWFDSQTDTNAAVIAALAGKSATNHTHSQYLTTDTNLFQEITIANRSQLGTNIAGLAQGTYTGVISSVSYTGVTALVIGRTYAWGFTKANAYGTSTLSIASFSLTATASGSTSNYFSYVGTDSNLVLKLDGDGSSKSDVSAVYVQQITNGNVNIANDLYIGGTFYINGLSIFDLPGINTNLSALNNDIGFLTNESVFLASVAYGVTAGNTSAWSKASSDAIAATNSTASLQTQIDNIGATVMQRYFSDTLSNVFVTATGTGVVSSLASTTHTFTVPAGVKVLGACIKWDNAAGTSFTIVMAEDGMNTTAANRCPAIFQAYRSDTDPWAPISGASCRPDNADAGKEIIIGLSTTPTTIIYCMFNWP